MENLECSQTTTSIISYKNPEPVNTKG